MIPSPFYIVISYYSHLKDILVWRQEHPEQKGRFAYKMYGRFDDVTALEFLEV